jgi:hypothetical protein
MSNTSEEPVIWEKGPYRRKVLVAATAVGRYMIARAYLGAPDHRLWLNGAPTAYRGTIEFLKRTVDEIIFGLAKPPDVEEATAVPRRSRINGSVNLDSRSMNS